MKKYSFLVLILLLNLTIVFGQNYYRSNSIGMIFEEIPYIRIKDFDWVLKLSIDGSLETRTIYFKGKEKNKFEYLKETDALTVNEYDSDSLVHVEHYKNGLLMNEKFFKDKQFVEEYIYQWSNRQLQETTYKENGKTIYTDTFITDPNGRLRQDRRLYAKGNMSIAGFSYSRQGLLNGWYGKDKDFLLYRYHEGKVVEIENWANSILNSSKIFKYSNSGSTETETDLLTGIVIVRQFDMSNNMLSEETRDGNNIQKSTYTYKDNMLIQKDISSPGLREKHVYGYSDNNSLYSEKIYRYDILIKEIFFKSGEKVMVKLYKDSSPILIVSYKNGEKIKEEQIR